MTFAAMAINGALDSDKQRKVRVPVDTFLRYHLLQNAFCILRILLVCHANVGASQAESLPHNTLSQVRKRIIVAFSI